MKEPLRRIVKIHNKYYDITNFAHPGGPIAIMAANRRDATALFESHHPFSDRTMMDNILKKYEMHEEREKCENYLLPGEKENGDIFDWEETLKSDFTIEVRDKVKKHFAEKAEQRGVTFSEATKATPQRWCEWGCFMGAAAWSFYTMLYSQSIFWSWLNMLLWPALYWMSGTMFHDGSHFAVSQDWRINLGIQYMYRIMVSPYYWLHQHIIGHHPYTNVHNKDPDLTHESLFAKDIKNNRVRYNVNTEWKTLHIGQEKMYYPVSSFVFLSLSLLQPLECIFTNIYNKCVYIVPANLKLYLFNVLDILLYLFIVFVLPFQIWTPFYAIKHAILPYYLLSIIFIFNSSVNHLHKDSVKGQNKNWYIHQVTTSNNFGNHWPHYYTSIGLNYQIEHHLFPAVNHCHLHDIQPIVKSLCEKHSIPYHHTGGYKEAIMGVYEHLREMGKKPVTEEKCKTKSTSLRL
jgi:delta11-fatty-acid desaturase